MGFRVLLVLAAVLVPGLLAQIPDLPDDVDTSPQVLCNLIPGATADFPTTAPVLPVDGTLIQEVREYCPPKQRCVNREVLALVVGESVNFTVVQGIIPSYAGACIPCTFGSNCTDAVTGTGIVDEFADFCTLDRPMLRNPDATLCDGGYQCIPLPPDRTYDTNITSAEGKIVPLDGACIPCILGMYCPKGTVNRYAQTRFVLCGEGQLCPTPIEKKGCPAGNLCPAGLSVTVECNVTGIYCPENTTMPEPCKAGRYCPSAAESLTCPKGSYCRELRTQPTKCPRFGICPPGSAGARTFPSALVFVVVAMVAVVLSFKAALWYYRKNVDFELEQVKNLFKSIEMINVILKNLIGMTEDSYTFKGLQKHKDRMAIKFDKLGLTVESKSGGKPRVVLEGVSGEFKDSRIIAVMGPSGCGKSTFLNVLTGKANYGKQTGDVYINGIKSEISKFKNNFGFVPQDDVVHEDLTVRENLMFNALMRLPPEYTIQRRIDIVNDVIKILGLHAIQDSIVGSVEERGISGGQRKRVNIGLELVSDPDVLFLDEPTSGLDSSASLEIIASLTDISRLGMTIIMVIHQPRYSLFSLFDDVLLLGAGKTVYCGPAQKALEYFQALGFQCPPMENPADFFLDVISGNVANPYRADFQASDLSRWWGEFTGEGKKAIEEEISKSASAAGPEASISVDVELSDIKRKTAKKGNLVPLLSKRKLDLPEEGHIQIPESWDGASPGVSYPAEAEGKVVATRSSEVEFDDITNVRSSVAERAIAKVGALNINDFLYGGHAWARNTVAAADDEVAAHLYRIGVAPNQIKALKLVFQQFDKDHDGTLDIDEMQNMLHKFGKEMTRDEVSKVLSEAGLGGQEKITFVDLLRKMYYAQRKLKKRVDHKGSIDEDSKLSEPKVRVPVKVHLQLQYFIIRDLIKLIRHYKRALFDIGLIMGTGLFVGFFLGSGGSLRKLPNTALFANLTVAILSSVYGLRWFSAERVNYWREMASGMSRVAFMFSKMIVQLWECLVHPILFAIIVDQLLVLEGHFGNYVALNLLIFWACSGMGMLVSVAVSPDKSLLVAALTPVIIGGFLSGFSPTYAESPPPLRSVINIFFGRWALEAFLTLQVAALPESARVGGDEVFDFTGLTFGQLPLDLWLLFLIGLVYRLLCYPFLRFVNRGKQI